ncbi:hypothetical protein OE88DRAFT_1665912 [Heliocybe sulcata]|uniref:Uncharacterized protein n=1 Tax=Heliocybe sulcata TaxID=5364 RepID=A0A5C3MT79_9AGAM|nr:hypothetical protein OE88DRAFT_1665912 [Heliocybe sulcata]
MPTGSTMISSGLQLSSSTLEHTAIAPARTASWVREHSSYNDSRHDPETSSPPSTYLKDEEEDRRTIASLPPRMLMRYHDGRPDEVISAEHYTNGRQTRRAKPAEAVQSRHVPAKRLPPQKVHAPPIQQSVSHPPSTGHHQSSSTSHNTPPYRARPPSTASTIPIPVPPPGLSRSLERSNNSRSHVRASSVPFPNGHAPAPPLDTRFLESRSVGGDGIGAGSTGGVPMSILESTGSVMGHKEQRRAAGPSGHSRTASDAGERRDIRTNSQAAASRGLSPVTGSISTDKASVIGTEVTGNWYMIKDSGQVPTTRRQSRPPNRRTLTKPPPGAGGRRSRSQSVDSTISTKGKAKELSPVSALHKSRPKDKPLPAAPPSNAGPPPSNSAYASSIQAGKPPSQTGSDRRPPNRTRSASTPPVPMASFGLSFGRRRPSQAELQDAEGKGSKGRPFFKRFFTTSFDRVRALEDVEAARVDFRDSHRKLVKSRPGLSSLPGFGPNEIPSDVQPPGLATSNATGHSQALSDVSQGQRPRSHSLDSSSYVMMSPPASLLNVPQRWRGPPTIVAPSTYQASEYSAAPFRATAQGLPHRDRAPVANPPSSSLGSPARENAPRVNGTSPGMSSTHVHARSQHTNAASTSHGRNHSLGQSPPESKGSPPRSPSVQSTNPKLPFSIKDYDLRPIKPLGRYRAGSQSSVASYAGTEKAARLAKVRRTSSVSSHSHPQPSRSLAGWLKSGFGVTGRRRRASESQARDVDSADGANKASPNGLLVENSSSASAPINQPPLEAGMSGTGAQNQDTIPLHSSPSRAPVINGASSAPAAQLPRSELYSPSASSSEISVGRSRPTRNGRPPSKSDFDRLYTTTIPTPPSKSPAPRDMSLQLAPALQYGQVRSSTASDSRFPQPARVHGLPSLASHHPWDPTIPPQFYEDRSRKSIGGMSQVSWNMRKTITIPIPSEGPAYRHLPSATQRPSNSTTTGASQPLQYVPQSPQQLGASTSATVQRAVPRPMPYSPTTNGANSQVPMPRGLHRPSPSAPSNYTYSNSLLERPNLPSIRNPPQPDTTEAETEAPVVPEKPTKAPLLRRFLGGRGKGTDNADGGDPDAKEEKKSRKGLSAESAAWR